MKNKIFFSLILLIVIYGCAQPIEKAPIVSEQQEPEVNVIEKEEVEEEIEEDEISTEVKELLGLADEKVKSISYKYKGPQTKDFFYEFFVKGDDIKYVIDPTFKALDVDEDAYDTIFLNKEDKSASAYCDNRKCKVKGKKTEFDYDDVYIWTPLDWLDNIKVAEKIGGELIDNRKTWKLDTNIGTIWIDTFFGVPLQAEFMGNLHQFKKVTFNDVKDEDIIPS